MLSACQSVIFGFDDSPVGAGILVNMSLDLVTTGCALAPALLLTKGLFSFPVLGAVTPGMAGKFFGNDLDIGEFLICIRNDRSYIIRVPKGKVEYCFY